MCFSYLYLNFILITVCFFTSGWVITFNNTRVIPQKYVKVLIIMFIFQFMFWILQYTHCGLKVFIELQLFSNFSSLYLIAYYC